MINTAREALSTAEHISSASSLKSLVSIVTLVATVLVVLFDSAALITIWQGPVVYQGVDFTTRGSDVVVADVTDPHLAHAGFRPGQTVHWQGRSEWRAAWPRPGDTLTVQTASGPATVRAAHQRMGPTLAAVAATTVLASIAVFIFAGVLCYRKPGIMTVALWLFLAANFNISWLLTIYSQLPEVAARPIVVLILIVFGGWSYYPLVWFALRFPDDRIRGRAMRVADYVWSAISVVALAWFVIDLSRATFGASGLGGSFEGFLWHYTIPQNLPLVVAVGAFLWVYARSGDATRQRTLWAIVGFVLMIVLGIIGNFAVEGSAELSPVGNACFMVGAFCPLAMIYAVLRHHLLDISFVVNRALVYSLLTALIVLAVGLVDWIAGKYLFETRAALAVEGAVIIGLGFILQRVHGSLERVVDRVIFAARHSAERHVERVIAGLAFARTHDAILQALVDEPRVALDLVSCSIFIDDDRALALRSHYGWHPGERAAIERDDSLARLLLAERHSIDIPEVHWHPGVAGLEDASLDIAIPLFSRNDLLGVALYGRHRNGSAIDPEERRLLQRLCEAAAVAYEAVALAQARAELAGLRSATA